MAHDTDINHKDSNGETALIYAAKSCDNDTIMMLADINQKDNNGNTALIYAVKRG